MIDEKIIVNTIEWIAENIYVVAFYVFALLVLQWVFVTIWIRIDAGRRYKELWGVALMTMIGMVPLIGLFLYLILRNKYSIDEKYYIELEKKALFSESLSVAECYNCKKINENENIFCSYCGVKLKKQCPKCGTYSSYYNSYCAQCGYLFVSENTAQRIDGKNDKNKNTAQGKNISNPGKVEVKKVKNKSIGSAKEFDLGNRLKGVTVGIKNLFDKLEIFFKNEFGKFKNSFSKPTSKK